jgi:hypothetical protein
MVRMNGFPTNDEMLKMHLQDIYAALEVEWGADPFRRIKDFQASQGGANARLSAEAGSGDEDAELRIAIGAALGNVIVAFAKPIEWIALEPSQAQDIAANLLRQARRVLDKSGRRV